MNEIQTALEGLLIRPDRVGGTYHEWDFWRFCPIIEATIAAASLASTEWIGKVKVGNNKWVWKRKGKK